MRFFDRLKGKQAPTLELVLDDIVFQDVDAVINAADNSLLGGTGVDGALHEAAGSDLGLACRALGGCPTGRAKATQGFLLPARHIIHTVAPIHGAWGTTQEQGDVLAWCYRSSLTLADSMRLTSVAFPLLGAGAYGWPADDAARVAVAAIRVFRGRHVRLVRMVAFQRRDLGALERHAGIKGTVADRPGGFRYHTGKSAT